MGAEPCDSIGHCRNAAILTAQLAGRARHHKEVLQVACRRIELAVDLVELAHYQTMLEPSNVTSADFAGTPSAVRPCSTLRRNSICRFCTQISRLASKVRIAWQRRQVDQEIVTVFPFGGERSSYC